MPSQHESLVVGWLALLVIGKLWWSVFPMHRAEQCVWNVGVYDVFIGEEGVGR